jgi:predicted transposase YdaD
MEPSAREVEAHAPADYHGLSSHPELEKADQLYFSKMYLHLLMQRFATKDSEEIRQMIAELVPVEETRCGRELIEKGIEKGIEQAVQGLHRQGVNVEVIAQALSLNEDAVLRIIGGS